MIYDLLLFRSLFLFAPRRIRHQLIILNAINICFIQTFNVCGKIETKIIILAVNIWPPSNSVSNQTEVKIDNKPNVTRDRNTLKVIEICIINNILIIVTCAVQKKKEKIDVANYSCEL